jgi:hypothetical protein
VVDLAIVGIPKENQIIPKADKASVYDKTEIDALLEAQAPLFNAITPLLKNINSETGKTELSLSTALTDSINAKASLTYVNEELAKKANEETTYNKTHIDSFFIRNDPYLDQDSL